MGSRRKGSGMNQQLALTTWTTALRSREYEQTTGELCTTYSDGSRKYCCLGVACEAMGLTGDESGQYLGVNSILPFEVAAWLLGQGMAELGDAVRDPMIALGTYTDRDGYAYMLRCTALNDEYHFTFEQIADLVDYFGIIP